MNQLKSLKNILSPMSWMFIYNFSIVYPTVLDITWQNFLIALLLDALGVIPVSIFNIRILKKNKKFTHIYFENLNTDAFFALSSEEKVLCIEEMIGFPSYWAKSIFYLSFLKVVFVGSWFVICADPGLPRWFVIVKFMAAISMITFYFSSAAYIESHDLISRYIKKLHHQKSLQEVFSLVHVPSPKGGEFEMREDVTTACIWIFMLVLQGLLLSNNHSGLWIPNWAAALFVGAQSFALVTRIWVLSRRYLVGGLHGIFDSIHRFKPDEKGEILALHSSPLLAHFERIINSMTERLRDYERELTSWIFQKAEESRYSSLGEVAGLVVHDLSSPLHVIHFCSQQLVEHPEKVFEGKYRQQLISSGERALDLVNALKSYLRSPGSSVMEAPFLEAHRYVLKILSTQFHDRGFERVNFVIDVRLEQAVLAISRPDLIHILMNLYGNSLENMLLSKENIPEIRIEWEEHSGQSKCYILLSDNGDGLSPETFEELTSFAYQNVDRKSEAEGGKPQKGSLGLRLVRRLIERYGGQLSVERQPRLGCGTTFRLSIGEVQTSSGRRNEPAQGIEPLKKDSEER